MAVSAAFVRPLPRALRPALPLRIRTLHASPPRLSATAAEASSIVLSLSPSAMATAATVVAAPASPVKKGLVVEAKDSKGGNFVVRIQAPVPTTSPGKASSQAALIHDRERNAYFHFKPISTNDTAKLEQLLAAVRKQRGDGLTKSSVDHPPNSGLFYARRVAENEVEVDLVKDVVVVSTEAEGR